jgi:hypothetical protein
MKDRAGEKHEGAKSGHTARRRGADESIVTKLDPSKYSQGAARKEECEEQLLAEYAGMMTLFVGGIAALSALAQSRNLFPKKFKPLELLMLGVATHKLSRMIAKDRITGALRAPFVRYKCSAGAGEVEEEPRGRGTQRAIGELITCPYCVGPWSASALGFGMLFAPRTTRFLASIFATIAISDFLNRAFAATKEK